VVREAGNGRLGVALNGDLTNPAPGDGHSYPLMATLPALYPEWLGDRSFLEVHGLRFPYIAGAMANGIATTDIVIAMAQAGMLSFFGSAGLPLPKVEAALDRIEAALGHTEATWGSNLIHSPNEPALEAGVVDLYLRRGVRRVSASAYMVLTPHVVRYAFTGVSVDASGAVQRKNYLFAKNSRPEVARRFMSPPPAEMLQKLVASGGLTAHEAQLAARLPVAEDIIVEADSGGHTDNQALTALFPTIVQLRNELAAQFGYTRPIRVGAAGGLGTPAAVASAFSLGAAFVLTGSVNQSAIESGLSPYGKNLLARADIADVVMAPAADMFELGVKVQVLKRGTMFGVRAQQLYDIYSSYNGIDDIPADVRAPLEKNILRQTLEEIWASTEAFFAVRDPSEVERAQRDPKHKMALCFRWYLGLSSKWAIAGDDERKMDYQIWCGPAMGSFNTWVAGTFLENPKDRTVVQIARNLLEGAAVITRAQQLRTYGVPVPAAAFNYRPRPLA
jgi:PfaD family protein